MSHEANRFSQHQSHFNTPSVPKFGNVFERKSAVIDGKLIDTKLYMVYSTSTSNIYVLLILINSVCLIGLSESENISNDMGI